MLSNDFRKQYTESSDVLHCVYSATYSCQLMPNKHFEWEFKWMYKSVIELLNFIVF